MFSILRRSSSAADSHVHFDILLPGIRAQLEVRAVKGIRENIKICAVKHEDKGPSLGAIKSRDGSTCPNEKTLK